MILATWLPDHEGRLCPTAASTPSHHSALLHCSSPIAATWNGGTASQQPPFPATWRGGTAQLQLPLPATTMGGAAPLQLSHCIHLEWRHCFSAAPTSSDLEGRYCPAAAPTPSHHNGRHCSTAALLLQTPGMEALPHCSPSAVLATQLLFAHCPSTALELHSLASATVTTICLLPFGGASLQSGTIQYCFDIVTVQITAALQHSASRSTCCVRGARATTQGLASRKR